MFSTGPRREEAVPSACGSGGESLEIVVAGESEPLAIGVVYMKFVVDTARVAQIKKLAVSGLLDECRKLAQPDKDLKAFLDDWAKTGPSIH
jgi:hypothetical protein